MRSVALEEIEQTEELELTDPLRRAMALTINDAEDSLHTAAVHLVTSRKEWLSPLASALASSLMRANMVTATMIVPAIADIPEALPTLLEVARRGDSPGALFARMFLSNPQHQRDN